MHCNFGKASCFGEARRNAILAHQSKEQATAATLREYDERVRYKKIEAVHKPTFMPEYSIVCKSFVSRIFLDGGKKEKYKKKMRFVNDSHGPRGRRRARS